MAIEVVSKDEYIEQLHKRLHDLREALASIAGLWPEPPHCAEVNPKWVGPNDGKQRAILLESALKISRAALAKDEL